MMQRTRPFGNSREFRVFRLLVDIGGQMKPLPEGRLKGFQVQENPEAKRGRSHGSNYVSRSSGSRPLASASAHVAHDCMSGFSLRTAST